MYKKWCQKCVMSLAKYSLIDETCAWSSKSKENTSLKYVSDKYILSRKTSCDLGHHMSIWRISRTARILLSKNLHVHIHVFIDITTLDWLELTNLTFNMLAVYITLVPRGNLRDLLMWNIDVIPTQILQALQFTLLENSVFHWTLFSGSFIWHFFSDFFQAIACLWFYLQRLHVSLQV